MGQVLDAIWAHKLRSFLTMFGIAWGVGSLLLLIGLGEGFRSGQRRQMATLGNDVIFLSGGNIQPCPASTPACGRTMSRSRMPRLCRKLPSVREVTAAVENETIQQISQYATTGGTVKGIDTYYAHIRALPMADGRLINTTISMTAATWWCWDRSQRSCSSPGGPRWGVDPAERLALSGHSVAAKTGRGNNNGVNQQAYIRSP